jgi:hypothetical protein
MSIFEGYSREPRPLRAYAVLIVVFNTLFGGLVARAARQGRLPQRVALGDIVLLGVAAHKLSRLVAKDRVTSVVRAPFATYQGAASGTEVNETPRGSGARLALGELLTCPYCIGQWIATALTCALLYAPRLTRLIAAMCGALAVSDVLNHAYDRRERRREQATGNREQ